MMRTARQKTSDCRSCNKIQIKKVKSCRFVEQMETRTKINIRTKINFLPIIHDTRLETTAEKRERKHDNDAALPPHNGRHPVESDATSRLTSEPQTSTAVVEMWGIEPHCWQKRHTQPLPRSEDRQGSYQGPAGGKIGGACPLWGKYPVAVFVLFYLLLCILFLLFFYYYNLLLLSLLIRVASTNLSPLCSTERQMEHMMKRSTCILRIFLLPQ